MLLPADFGAPRLVTLSAPHVSTTHATGRAADDLFARRLRRRFAAYLRLRLLELREARLERAAAAIERRIPPASLVDER